MYDTEIKAAFDFITKLSQGDVMTLVGTLLVVTGFFDAIKYHWESTKIRLCKTSKGHSRKFIIAALVSDIVKIAYGLMLQNWYLILSALFACVFMCEMFWVIYKHYPYQTYPRQVKVKRPGLFIYILNSLVPNKYKKSL